MRKRLATLNTRASRLQLRKATKPLYADRPKRSLSLFQKKKGS